MGTSKKLNITTLIFIIILIAGVIGFSVYINNSFTDNTNKHTHVQSIPFSTVVS
jgi:uncharacterized membrane protein YuzA (DUF378 family)